MVCEMKKMGILSTVAVLLIALPAGAQIEMRGFVEWAGGARLQEAQFPAGPGGEPEKLSDFVLRETRLQLKADAYGDIGEAHFVADVLADQVLDETSITLREAYMKFNAFADHLEVRAGRQPTTWGTGDLLFINDLFPKDYVSFFIGREDQYLKFPSDALRLGLYGLPMVVDFVYTPEFTPDILPNGQRLVFWAPPVADEVVRPPKELENGEVALRLSRYLGSYNLALYGYWGFWKAPLGVWEPFDGTGDFYHPKLNVYGASVRGPLFGGVGWLEGGYYDSADDRDGVDLSVPNSEIRAMAGYERQWWSDFTGGAQAYWEGVQDYQAREYVKEENRLLLTLRLTQMLRYQTVKLSAFGFYSPTEEEVYARLLVGYDYSDRLNLAVGTNLFTGSDERTLFGMNEDNSNVYLRARYSF
jgi:hypothetical protein